MKNYESKDLNFALDGDILDGELITISNESTYERVRSEIEDDPDVACWDDEIFHYVPDEVFEKEDEKINEWLVKELFNEFEAGGSLR